MGLFTRPDSPWWWAYLERPGQRGLKVNTGVPLEGGSPEQNKSLKAAAQAIYAAQMTDLAKRRYHLPATEVRRTFAAHRTWYAEHVTAHKRGKTRELSMLGQLAAFFDGDDLKQIDHARVREWRTWRLETVSVSTVRREEAILKHLLTTAVPQYLEANPLKGLARLRVPTPDTRVLTTDEESRLLTVLKGEDRALVVVALDTLLRLRNVADLTRAQDHRTYLFAETKVGPVKVPLSARARQALDSLPKKGPAFFPSYAQRSNNFVIRMFAEACARAGVQTGRKGGGISFHCLRHTGASRMLAAGVDVKTVMEIGGWKNLAVLERYLHPTAEHKRAAVNRIGVPAPLPAPSKSTKRQRKSA